MNENIKQLEYIRDQLAWIKSKVQLDNQLGLHDINKLSEDIFMHILNDVYDLNLQNANDMLHNDFPSIDLVDGVNKKVIQVTSTKTLLKARDTVKKLEDLKFHKVTDKTSASLKNSISFFRNLKDYKDYELSFLYIKEKPNITKKWTNLLEEEGLSEDNILGIDDILKIIQSNPSKCQIVYKTIQQRMDNISFKFNIDSYFDSFEPHLEKNTSHKFKGYESSFTDFIQSANKVFKLYAVGGNGKSHLLKYFASIKIEYIPLIFTKQINIEEDLKKLGSNKKYLLVFDDIDRFLDTPILVNLLSYSLSNDNIKCMISYRTASKNIIETVFRKYNHIDKQELEIIWNTDECQELIKSIAPNLEEQKVTKIAHQFNNNPYLITQALHGKIDNIKDFSKKIVDDTQVALEDFNLSVKEINDLLFELSLLSPLSKRNVSKEYKEYKEIIDVLVDKKILRELASKYRFNPDMLGDLYLANYIDENKSNFEQIIESNLTNFSDTVFTNLSYALVYNKSDSLQDFIKKIINRWIANQEYKNEYLELINKIVYYAPMESFIYLEKATKQLKPKSTNALGMDSMWRGIVTTFSPPNGDWSSDGDAINLESIEPIISKLIVSLKNNVPCEELKINHIINYLTSDIVVALPKPYYDNQTLDSIFKKLVSPLDTRNFDTILQALEIMDKWLYEVPMNYEKIDLLKKSVESLLSSTFDTTSSEGFTFTMGHTALNLKHKKILEIIEYSKNILLKMLESDNTGILYKALDLITNIGGHFLDTLSKENQEFYLNIKKEALSKCKEVLKRENNFYTISKIEDLAIRTLQFSSIKDEALSVLNCIDRNNEYIFYQIIKNTDVLILNYQEFYINCMQQEDVGEWINQNERKKAKDKKPSANEWEIIDTLLNQYKTSQRYLDLLNSLDMSAWNSTHTLMLILKKWLSADNKTFIDTAMNHLEKIDNKVISNVLKEALLLEGLVKVNIDDITEQTSESDIRIYTNAILKKYDANSLNILQKIIDVSKNKDAQYIRWIISIVSRDMYFKIKDNIELYNDFEPFIIQFLEWQLDYTLDVESYITHHILYDTILPIGKISDKVKNILEKIVKNENIVMNEFKLKPIYEVLGYGLIQTIDILYTKLISKKEDGTYKYTFTHYFDHSDITEVILMKSYVHNYEDFKFLVDKTLSYYLTPVEIVTNENREYERRIHLDYFLKYAQEKEYIERLFDELVIATDIKKIKFLYTIVPVSYDYVNIIIKNLNLLNDKVEDKELINYLTQMGKIKSWSSSPMQNSDLVLSEEVLFTEIYNRVDSLSLRLKLKEELKYIEIRKREEIEEDIAYLLGK
ncbi:MAG: SMEK domain-containing protein [Sulfurovum sp.]